MFQKAISLYWKWFCLEWKLLVGIKDQVPVFGVSFPWEVQVTFYHLGPCFLSSNVVYKELGVGSIADSLKWILLCCPSSSQESWKTPFTLVVLNLWAVTPLVPISDILYFRYLHFDSKQQQNYSHEVATKIILQLGFTPTWGTVLKGLSIRKVGNHCFFTKQE